MVEDKGGLDFRLLDACFVCQAERQGCEEIPVYPGALTLEYAACNVGHGR